MLVMVLRIGIDDYSVYSVFDVVFVVIVFR